MKGNAGRLASRLAIAASAVAWVAIAWPVFGRNSVARFARAEVWFERGDLMIWVGSPTRVRHGPWLYFEVGRPDSHEDFGLVERWVWETNKLNGTGPTRYRVRWIGHILLTVFAIAPVAWLVRRRAILFGTVFARDRQDFDLRFSGGLAPGGPAPAPSGPAPAPSDPATSPSGPATAPDGPPPSAAGAAPSAIDLRPTADRRRCAVAAQLTRGSTLRVTGERAPLRPRSRKGPARHPAVDGSFGPLA